MSMGTGRPGFYAGQDGALVCKRADGGQGVNFIRKEKWLAVLIYRLKNGKVNRDERYCFVPCGRTCRKATQSTQIRRLIIPSTSNFKFIPEL